MIIHKTADSRIFRVWQLMRESLIRRFLPSEARASQYNANCFRACIELKCIFIESINRTMENRLPLHFRRFALLETRRHWLRKHLRVAWEFSAINRCVRSDEEVLFKLWFHYEASSCFSRSAIMTKLKQIKVPLTVPKCLSNATRIVIWWIRHAKREFSWSKRSSA